MPTQSDLLLARVLRWWSQPSSATRCWRIFTPFFGTMSWAVFLAFLLYPVNLQPSAAAPRQRPRGRRLTVLTPIVILLPLWALSIEFVAQISGLLRTLQQRARELDIKSLSDLQQFPLIARANAWLQAHGGISADQVAAWVISASQDLLQRAAGLSGSFFLGALGSLIGFAIMLFLLFFFLRDGDAMCRARARTDPAGRAAQGPAVSPALGVTRAIVLGYDPHGVDARRAGRHRIRHRRASLAGGVRRAGGAAGRCFPSAARASSGSLRWDGFSTTGAGALRFSCWRGADAVGPRECAAAGVDLGAGAISRRWRYSSAFSAGSRRSAPSASSWGRWCCRWCSR